jgi:light-regulated signal transduction histidine kinase (bacteriophytochrome)
MQRDQVIYISAASYPTRQGFYTAALYFRGDEQFEGTGIGLATVRRVVTRLDGRCWAEGAVGGGATFFFTLGDGDADPGASPS